MTRPTFTCKKCGTSSAPASAFAPLGVGIALGLTYFVAFVAHDLLKSHESIAVSYGLPLLIGFGAQMAMLFAVAKAARPVDLVIQRKEACQNCGEREWEYRE